MITTASYHQLSATPYDYWQLLKPRVMSLVVFTGFVGMMAAPGKIHPIMGFCAILCIALGAGSAGCLNMWWERNIDALMERTKGRPIPQRRIAPDSALAFGIILSIASVLLMAVGVNYQAAYLLAFTIIFYVVFYTMYLKPRTPQNIVLGGLAGAMPPVIGWACVADGFDLFPWIMCAIIFFWTPAHFWALSMQFRSDYAQSKLPMLPNMVSEQTTLRWILFYTTLTVLISFIPYMLGFMATTVYLINTILSGVYLLVRAIQLCRGKIQPMSFFASSIYYLFIVFVGILLSR
jgi:protoheme IX farnesyltransferase